MNQYDILDLTDDLLDGAYNLEYLTEFQDVVIATKSDVLITQDLWKKIKTRLDQTKSKAQEYQHGEKNHA